SAAAFAAFSSEAVVTAEVDFADLFAHRLAHFGDAVADGGGAFEFERFGGGVHFDFQLGDVFLGDVLSFVGAAHSSIGPGVSRGLAFNAVADRFLNRRRRDVVLAVIFFLNRTAAIGFFDGVLHRI